MIKDKFDRSKNPDWDPDALVEVTFFGRKTIAGNGYRPHYKVMGDYLTTTAHWFIETGEALPNEATLAFVKLVTPEKYPHCLAKDMIIDVGESSKVIGHAKILEVYNELLLQNS